MYTTVDRPDNKTVRDLYASPDAARAATAGQPLPEARERPDGADAHLVGIFVMEKRRGWGAEYPKHLRNGMWDYARFTAAGGPAANFDAKPCFNVTSR